MKIGSFLVLFLYFTCISCEVGNYSNGIATTKPGHFCQLEGVALTSDKVIIAGSFIPTEDPNIATQPVHSYLAAFYKTGELIWEQKPEAADYIRWGHLQTWTDQIYVAGIMESPIEGYNIALRQINPITGETVFERKFPAQGSPVIHDMQVTGEREVILLRTSENDTQNCTYQQIVLADRNTDLVPFCKEGILQGAQFLSTSPSYFTFYGNGPFTTQLYQYPTFNTSSVKLPLGFSNALINDVQQTSSQQTILAATIKNEKGPCVWKLSQNAQPKNVCLNHWPLHGNTQMLLQGKCVIVVFNAATPDNANVAQATVLNANLEVAWQYEIESDGAFMVKDLASDGKQLYVAGTMETPGEGSAMALKIIELPTNNGCPVLP